jgi:hypothetical protein
VEKCLLAASRRLSTETVSDIEEPYRLGYQNNKRISICTDETASRMNTSHEIKRCGNGFTPNREQSILMKNMWNAENGKCVDRLTKCAENLGNCV